MEMILHGDGENDEMIGNNFRNKKKCDAAATSSTSSSIFAVLDEKQKKIVQKTFAFLRSCVLSYDTFHCVVELTNSLTRNLTT